MKTFTLVQGVGHAMGGINSFMGSLMGSLFSKREDPLAGILRSTQSWYAYEYETDGLDDEDGFMFGPSKFVGYKDMDPETYLANNGISGPLNGRDTEKALAKISTPLTPDDPRYEAAFTALAELCAKFGKTPNTRARISLLNIGQEERIATEAEQVKALATLIAALSEDGRKQLKRIAFP